MDKASAIRAALNKLGERNFKENASTYDPAVEEWQRAILTACAAHNWTFTRSVTTLSAIENTAHGAIYNYPPDCLSVIHLVDADNRRISWRPYTNKTIITPGNTATPTCIYNNNSLACSDSIPDSDPAFTDYFIALLASRIAPCVLGGEQGISLSQALMQEASHHLSEARTRDAQQYASNDDAHPLREYLRLNSTVRL